MRVAIVQHGVDARRGGAETSTVEMARCLAQAGAEVTVVCVAGALPPPAKGLAFHPIPVGGLGRAQQIVRFMDEAARYCRMEAFDIVHAITPCFAANVYQPRGGTYPETVRRGIAGGRSPWGRFIRWVGRATNLRQRLLLRAERALLSDPRGPVVAAVSAYVQRQVISDYGLHADRTPVIFNGVDIEPLPDDQAAALRAARRAALQVPDSTPVALFAAHNFALKGLRELIEAAAAPAGRAARFITVVSGRDAVRPYERLAARLGVSARLQFCGSSDDMRGWYAAADVLAHPTWYDPCSRVVLEALCCGLPVVTTRWNGAAEAIADGRNGVVVDEPQHADALATAIAAAAGPAMRAALQKDGPALRTRLSMSRHARELLTLYAAVARRGRASGSQPGEQRPDAGL